jgi:carbonic anhydrase
MRWWADFEPPHDFYAGGSVSYRDIRRRSRWTDILRKLLICRSGKTQWPLKIVTAKRV